MGVDQVDAMENKVHRLEEEAQRLHSASASPSTHIYYPKGTHDHRAYRKYREVGNIKGDDLEFFGYRSFVSDIEESKTGMNWEDCIRYCHEKLVWGRKHGKVYAGCGYVNRVKKCMPGRHIKKWEENDDAIFYMWRD